jgi:hypothetical protein
VILLQTLFHVIRELFNGLSFVERAREEHDRHFVVASLAL